MPYGALLKLASFQAGSFERQFYSEQAWAGLGQGTINLEHRQLRPFLAPWASESAAIKVRPSEYGGKCHWPLRSESARRGHRTAICRRFWIYCLAQVSRSRRSWHLLASFLGLAEYATHLKITFFISLFFRESCCPPSSEARLEAWRLKNMINPS